MSAQPHFIPNGSADDPSPAGDGTATAETAAADRPPWSSEAGQAPQTGQRIIPVEALTAHPGNVRRDLDLNPEFLASIQGNGVLVPLRITTTDGESYRVIEGHRRLAAAIKVGLAEVPYDLAAERAADEAGQYLDMVTLNRHRNPLTPLEEADALFAAREAGAAKTRIRKSTGLKAAQVNAALGAAELSAETRDTVAGLDYDLTLEDLAILAEFQDDPEALARLVDAASYSDTLEHHAQRLRLEREERAEHERLRAELEGTGITITDTLPPGAQTLINLRHDGEELTAESHAACPGRGAFFRSYDLINPVHYCADPDAYGHALASAGSGITSWAGSGGTSGVPDDPAAPGPADSSRDTAAEAAARRLVIQGNRAWKAAAEVRHRWLASQLFARRSAPREVSAFIAAQLLTMPDPLRTGLSTAHGRTEFAEITGQQASHALQACPAATASKLPLLALAPIVTAYEIAMTEGEGKSTWRPDRYSPCPYTEAGRYLAFLASVGYQLSAIEQAVAEGTPYTGDTSPGDPLPAATSAVSAREGEDIPQGRDDAGTLDPECRDDDADTASPADAANPDQVAA